MNDDGSGLGVVVVVGDSVADHDVLMVPLWPIAPNPAAVVWAAVASKIRKLAIVSVQV